MGKKRLRTNHPGTRPTEWKTGYLKTSHQGGQPLFKRIRILDSIDPNGVRLSVGRLGPFGSSSMTEFAIMT